MDNKTSLRHELRQRRRDHVAAFDPRIKALLFMRPPGPVADMLDPGQSVGLYHAGPAEAPALAYGRWLHERGHPIALPWFETRDAPMRFRLWETPYSDAPLEPGPFGIGQLSTKAEEIDPAVLFVPLIGFTATGARLGQGGGHYDRWLAAHPGTKAIGMAWDCQLVDALPTEAHDRNLDAVVTPTRLYGPWEIS